MTTYHIQVPNLQKKAVTYDTDKPTKQILRARHYCSVCKKESYKGWGSLEPCPFCGARFSDQVKYSNEPLIPGHWGTCRVRKYYNPREVRYIMNRAEGWRSLDP